MKLIPKLIIGALLLFSSACPHTCMFVYCYVAISHSSIRAELFPPSFNVSPRFNHLATTSRVCAIL